jgi:hypothetical protein
MWLKDRVIRLFFFAEAKITVNVYLDMLKQFMYPQVVELQLNTIHQQDGPCPPSLRNP